MWSLATRQMAATPKPALFDSAPRETVCAYDNRRSGGVDGGGGSGSGVDGGACGGCVWDWRRETESVCVSVCVCV